MIHGFIDGYSRLITGLRASDNNTADTVLELFFNAAHVSGVPSRMREDHGAENLQHGWILTAGLTEALIFGAGESTNECNEN